jgi:hypothetical protein
VILELSEGGKFKKVSVRPRGLIDQSMECTGFTASFEYNGTTAVAFSANKTPEGLAVEMSQKSIVRALFPVLGVTLNLPAKDAEISLVKLTAYASGNSVKFKDLKVTDEKKARMMYDKNELLLMYRNKFVSITAENNVLRLTLENSKAFTESKEGFVEHDFSFPEMLKHTFRRHPPAVLFNKR